MKRKLLILLLLVSIVVGQEKTYPLRLSPNQKTSGLYFYENDPPIIPRPIDESLVLIPYDVKEDISFNNIFEQQMIERDVHPYYFWDSVYYAENSIERTGKFNQDPAFGVPVSHGYFDPVIYDFTGDGVPEVIGRYMNLQHLNPYDSAGTIYDNPHWNYMVGISDFHDNKVDSVPRFLYPSQLMLPRGPFDFDGDGLLEITLSKYRLETNGNYPTRDTLYVFEQRTPDSYPDSLMFKQRLFNWEWGVLYNSYNVGDVDGDGRDELWIRYGNMYTNPHEDNRFYICEYDPEYNEFYPSFELPRENIPGATRPETVHHDAWVTADFDLDGKNELIITTWRGYIYVVKGVSDGQYEVSWSGFVGKQGERQSSATGHCLLNDINGNGKPELLITNIQVDTTQRFIALNTIIELDDSDSVYIVDEFYVENYEGQVVVNGSSDANNDGLTDITFTNIFNANWYLTVGWNKNLNKFEKIYMARQSGPKSTYELNKLFGMSFYDVNGDGFSDLLLNCYAGVVTMTFILEDNGGYGAHVMERKAFFYTNVYLAKDPTVNIEHKNAIAGNFKLKANHPNPFNPQTTIPFSLGAAGRVSLKIYDVLGRHVITLLDDVRYSQGTSSVPWDVRNMHGNSVASGVYWCVMESGSYKEARKMLLIR